MKHFLIDGYNFLFKSSFSEKTLQSKRDAFHKKIQLASQNLHFEITIIYDGKNIKDQESGFTYFSSFRVYYTCKNQSADDYILEVVENSLHPSRLVIVTTDKNLARQCSCFGSQILSCKKFETLFLKKRSKKSSKEKIEESEEEKNRLANIFNKRMKNL